MDVKAIRSKRLAQALLALGVCLAAGQASAAEFWLCAKAGTVDLPGQAGVPIWGYVNGNGSFAGCDTASPVLPGPALSVPAGDTTLTIHLRNELTQEPTSIVMPGQITTMTPVMFTDGSGRQRVRSFTHEAPPSDGTTHGTADYTWSNLRPGTYLYHSGTHSQVQVQMGLYGALAKNAVDATTSTPAQAYAGVPYDAAATLVLSEIDPAQHAAIAAGTFGTSGAPDTPCLDTDGSPMKLTSALCYRPKFFLINGQPYEAGDPPLASIAQGQNTLLRLLNAGYRAYVPLLQGMHMRMIAEDGNRYVYRQGATVSPRDQFQYSTWLAALKTTDVVISPTQVGDFPIYDRRLNTVNAAAQDGGIFGVLRVAQATSGDLSIAKTSNLTEVLAGTPLQYTVVVTNASTSPVSGAVVNDPMAPEFSGFSWTCSATLGSSCGVTGASGSISNVQLNLLASGVATFTVNATVSVATAATSVTNTATVTPPASYTDPNPANNTASVTTTILPPQADLAVTKTRLQPTVTAGTPVTYTIVASNAGPNAAPGATVTDTLPASLSGATWTCSASPGSTCPASGSGNLNATVNLAVGGTTTFTVNALVASSAGGSTLANTATVSHATIVDPVASNNSATDSTTVLNATANLGITKTHSPASPTAPGPLTYTIVVSNGGPSRVDGVAVADTLPATLTGVSWTCGAPAGSTCALPIGAGNIATTVNLASGGAATFTVSSTIPAGTTGTLSNTATLTVPPGVIDSSGPGNDSATDTFTIAAPTVVAYFSTAGNTTLPGVAAPYDDADIYAYYNNGTYARVFDASTTGVPAGANVDAFIFNGPSDVYLSFNNNGGITLPGVGTVQDEDIVRWNGTSWSMFFQGSAAGLNLAPNAANKDVDAFALLPDGSLLVSITGAGGTVNGVAGVTQHDILRCAGTFGAPTTCTSWTMYFDASDIGLTAGGENVRYIKVMANGDIHLNTTGAFSVTSGANTLTGNANQVFACTAPTTGAASACGGFAVVRTLPTLTTGAIDAVYVP